MARSLAVITKEILADWPKPYFGAVPYLYAMGFMNSVNESYGADDGKSIVLYFLANAKGWKGPVAKAIKAELKAALKGGA